MDKLIPDLTASGALSGTDLFEVWQGGPESLKLTGSQLLTYVGGSFVPYSLANATVDLNTQRLNSGLLYVGGGSTNGTGKGILRVTQDSTNVDIGTAFGGGVAAIWMATTNTDNNFALAGTGSRIILNAPSVNGRITFAGGNSEVPVEIYTKQSGGLALPGVAFTPSDRLLSTASLNYPNWYFYGGTTQWATGAIALQYEFYIRSATWSAVGASTMTDGYSLYVDVPIAGSNMTITNKWAAGFNGKVRVNGAMRIVDGTQANGYVLTSDASGNTSWQAAGGGGGTPAGSNTQIQFNNAGAFGASSGLTWDDTSKIFTASGTNGSIIWTEGAERLRVTSALGSPTFQLLTGSNYFQAVHGSGGTLLDSNSGGAGKFVFNVEGSEMARFTTTSASFGPTQKLFWDNANTLLYVNGNSGAFADTRLQMYGNVNSFAQSNFQNTNAGTSASGDHVITADTGTNTTNFVNMGINSSTFSLGTFTIGGALDSYYYCDGGHLLLGTATAAKDVKIFTAGTLAANLRATFGTSTLTIAEAYNVVLGTTTGTKFGTATTQKIGFFNATPIVQVGATIDLGVVLSNLGLRAAGTAYTITTSGALSFGGTIGLTGTSAVTLGARNFVLDTTTGTKWGTATTQKQAWFNATPIVQVTTGVTAAAFVANTSGTLNDSATYGGYTIGQIVSALKNYGFLA